MRRFLAALTLLAALALPAAGPLFAQADLQVELQTGFRGIYQTPGWVPFRLSVQNLGAPVSGTLSVEVPVGGSIGDSTNGYVREYTLDIGRSSRKEFALTLPILEGFSPVKLQILSDGRALLERSINLPRPLSGGELIVVLSRNPSLDFLMSGRGGGAGAGAADRDGDGSDAGAGGGSRAGSDTAPGPSRRIPVYPLPEQLPERWEAYDAVSALVVDGADLNRLSGTQRRALEQWVRAGGGLVLVGGSDFRPSSVNALSQWLPFRVRATTPLAETGVLATDFQPRREAETLRDQNGVRVLSAGYGEGHVVSVNVSPEDLTRLGSDPAPVWEQVLGAAGTASPLSLPINAGRQPLEQPLLTDLVETSNYRFPSQWMVLLVGAAYVVAVWLLLRFAKRFAALFPALVAALLLGTYALLAPPHFAGAQLERYLGASDQTIGRLRSDIVLFSTSPHRYELRMPAESTPIPLEHRRTRTTAEGLVRGEVRSWRVVNHLGMQLDRQPVAVQRSDDGAGIVLHNRGDIDMSRGVVLVGDRSYATGPLPIDERRTVEIDEQNLLQRTSSRGERRLSSWQSTSLSRIRALQGSSYPEGPLFVGWRRELRGPASVMPAPRWVGQMSLVVISLPTEWFADG